MIEAGRVGLTEYERGFFALTLQDALTPLGMEYDSDRAAQLIEARLAVLLAARGERGYHEGWRARSGVCDECEGTGVTVQGWTDKGGEPEDQYGPCASCQPVPPNPFSANSARSPW